jgi:hypothetical protein
MLVTCDIGTHSVATKSHNISEKGILLEADDHMQKGQQVQLSFQLPDSQFKMPLVGIVRRLEGRLAGVSFASLTATDRQRLRILIDKYLEHTR